MDTDMHQQNNISIYWSLIQNIISASRTFVKIAGLIICFVGLFACVDSEVHLSGERESVFTSEIVLTPDDEAAAELAGLGQAIINRSFGHPGGNAAHEGGHLSLKFPLQRLWSAQIADTDTMVVTLPQPVAIHDKIFALGGDAGLSVFALNTGEQLAFVQIDDANAGLYPGVAGGLAANDRVVVAHAGRKTLTALDSVTNEVKWSVTHDEPLAGGPTLFDDEGVIVTDIDGSTLAFRLSDGVLVWQNAGLPADTIVLGSGSPAVRDGMVVIAGIGGEVSANAVGDGDLLWADSLASLTPRTPLEELGDILADPVHDGETVYVVSQSGLLGAYDPLTGIQLWEQPLSSVQTPWVAGDSLFVLTTNSHIVCLRKSDGAVRWHADLPGSAELGMISATNVSRYVGPIVASGQVHVISVSGRLYSLDADTGTLVNTTSLGGSINVPPVIAQDTLFVLGRNGELQAYR